VYSLFLLLKEGLFTAFINHIRLFHEENFQGRHLQKVNSQIIGILDSNFKKIISKHIFSAGINKNVKRNKKFLD
jgi:hypothetical protein